MSRLFPELPRDVAGHILADGIRVKHDDSDSERALDCLVDLGVVSACEHHYVRCVYRKDYDFAERRDLNCDARIEVRCPEGEYYCPNCGQPIGDVARKTHFVEYEVRLSPKGIQEYVEQALGSLEVVRSTERIGRAALRAELRDGRSLKVVIAEYAEHRHQAAGLFFGEPTLYVVASSIHDDARSALEELQYAQLADLLSEPAVALEERLMVAAVPIEGRRDLSNLDGRFGDMLARHGKRRWQFFEQRFVPTLIRWVTEHAELSERYLGKLRRLRGTVFGTYYVPIGGSGVTDLRGIDKYELMAELVRGKFIGDAKCYPDSTLDYSNLTSVITHLETDPTRPDRAIAFVAGDDVSSTSWDLMMRLRDRWGYWRLAILPRYVLIELVDELDAVQLLDM